MRKLQLGTSLEGPSQITPTSPCHGHLLPEEEEEEEEDDDLGNGEEESCKLSHFALNKHNLQFQTSKEHHTKICG